MKLPEKLLALIERRHNGGIGFGFVVMVKLVSENMNLDLNVGRSG